jgi:hypothetical protein
VNTTTPRRLAAIAMITASLLAIAGFTALGSVFEYPQILQSPTTDILAAYREHQGAITAWFLVLAISAGLLAPVGVLLGRLSGGRRGRWIAGVGVAAAVVQVVGLSRWVLLIPGVSDDALVPSRTVDAVATFERLHFWLGTILGETVGYVLTATFTVLVASIAGRRLGTPRWLALLGYASAALIVTGVLVPLGVGIAGLTNFAGYVAWCLWLVALGAVLLGAPRSVRTQASLS